MSARRLEGLVGVPCEVCGSRESAATYWGGARDRAVCVANASGRDRCRERETRQAARDSHARLDEMLSERMALLEMTVGPYVANDALTEEMLGRLDQLAALRAAPGISVRRYAAEACANDWRGWARNVRSLVERVAMLRLELDERPFDSILPPATPAPKGGRR